MIQALVTYIADQRDEAIERTRTGLDELDKRIDNDWDQMNKTTAPEKASANLKALRKQLTEVAEWYGRLKTSSADAWEHIMKVFSETYKKLSDTWEKSIKEFSTNK